MQAISVCMFFCRVLKVDKNQKGAPRRGQEAHFENDKSDVHVDCDRVKIRENRKLLPTEGPRAGSIILKMSCAKQSPSDTVIFAQMFHWLKQNHKSQG